MLSAYKMVIDDPGKFHLLSEDLKRRVLKAAIGTVNVQAALTRRNAVAKQGELLNIRNDWTARQTVFTKCPANVASLDAVQATVGATEKAGYMEQQEVGGWHTPRKGSLLNIPTDAAREGGRFAGKVASGYAIRDIRERKLEGKYKKSYTSPKARAVARAFVAAKENKVIHYGKNVFEVTSFRKSGDNITFEKRLVRNLGQSQTYTPPTPWLEPASQKPAEDCQAIFNAQMDKIDRV